MHDPFILCFLKNPHIQVGTRFRIYGSAAVVGLSVPLPSDEQWKDEAYFLEEIRDYSQVLPNGHGRVLQQRRKMEMLTLPDAPLNRSTAAELFLFQEDTRPVLKEIRRILAVWDLRVRVWMIDSSLEWLLWVKKAVATKTPLDVKEAEEEKGEKMVQKELHINATE